MTRRPLRRALGTSALPSLAALLAGGLVAEGCDGADTREARLREHGERAGDALHGGQLARALRELGIGLGVLEAPPVESVTSAGAPPAVRTLPADTTPPIARSGEAAPVQPTPPPAPVEPAHTAGRIRRVDPTPPSTVGPHGAR